MTKLLKTSALFAIAAAATLCSCGWKPRNLVKKDISDALLLYLDYKKPIADRSAGERSILSFLEYTTWAPAYVLSHSSDSPITPREYVETLQYLIGLRRRVKDYDYVLIKSPEMYWLALLMFFGQKVNYVYYSTDVFSNRILSEIEATVPKFHKRLRYLTYSFFEPQLWRRAQTVFTNREDEQEEIFRVNKDARYVPTRVIDNPLRKSANRSSRAWLNMVFVGGAGNLPNVSSLQQFISTIADKLSAQGQEFSLVIVGGGWDLRVHPFLERNYITLVGRVCDEKLTEIYGDADFAIGFMSHGAGIKGKVIEAMENGVFVIANEVGAEGIPEAVLPRFNTYSEVALILDRVAREPTLYGSITESYWRFLRANYSESSLKNALKGS